MATPNLESYRILLDKHFVGQFTRNEKDTF